MKAIDKINSQRDKARRNHAVTPLPHWCSARLYPLLTGDEAKLHGYIVYLTWGSHLRMARISKARMLYGSIHGTGDCGAGLSQKGLQRALRGLFEHNVIRVTGRWSWREELPYELTPEWEDGVSWEKLIERWKAQQEANARRAENFGASIEVRIPDSIAIMASAEEIASARREFEDAFDIVTYAGQFEDVATEENIMRKVDEERRDRVMTKLKIPAFVRNGEFPPSEWEAMTNVFLRLSRQAAVAAILDDDMSHLSDKVLAEAHDCASVAILQGAKLAADLEGLEGFWRKSWQYKKAIEGGIENPVPTLGQLKALLPQYMAERPGTATAVAPRATAPADESAFVISDLDGWQPKTKKKKR